MSCPACHSPASSLRLGGARDILHGTEGEWNLLECADCGLVYTFPFIPENRIGEHYPGNYTAYGSKDAEETKPYVRFLKSLLILPYTLRFGEPGYFPAPFGDGRMLDVGCGAGLYLRQMSELGWQCTGADISGEAIKNAGKLNPAAELLVGSLNDVPPGERYDLITMNHVLEHMQKPQEAIAGCWRRLRPGGRLAVSGPNIASVEAMLFGRRWIGLDIPRHLVHFREEVLENLLREAGFDIGSKRPGMFASSVSESLLLCLPAAMRRKMIHSRSGHFFYRMFLPFAALSYLMGNRGTVEIVAVKRKAAEIHS